MLSHLMAGDGRFVGQSRPRYIRLALTSWLLLQSSTTLATTTPPALLSLQDALSRTLQYSPQLQQQPLAVRQQALHRLQAAATPVPELTLSAENIAGSSSQSRGLQQGEYSVTFNQLLEDSAKQQARLQLNTAGSHLLQQQQRQQQLTVLADTVRAYQQLQRLQLLTRWTEHRRQTEQQILQIAKQRQAAALMLAAEVSRLQLRLLQTELQQQQLAAATLQAKAELAALWGASADFDQVEPLPGRFAAITGLDTVATTIATSTAVAKLVIGCPAGPGRDPAGTSQSAERLATGAWTETGSSHAGYLIAIVVIAATGSEPAATTGAKSVTGRATAT